MNNVPLLLGCIGDDFTGSSDAASFLVNEGIPTILCNGIPKDPLLVKGCVAVVIALKTRSIEPKIAKNQTLEAIDYLESAGAKQFYIKYCSTFDSTPKGNIGTTVDAAIERLKVPYTILAPGLPVNKRIIKDGILYVDGVLLSESHMRNHPLNPMWASEIGTLMKDQGKYKTIILKENNLYKKELEKIYEEYDQPFYIVPDHKNERDGKRIDRLFGSLKLLTGSSGILKHLGERYKKEYKLSIDSIFDNKTIGNGLALSGSCSKATKDQVLEYSKQGPVLFLDYKKLKTAEQTFETVWSFIKKHKNPLVYSCNLDEDNNLAEESDCLLLEDFFSKLASKAISVGYKSLIVAGGETSGAVIQKLAFDAFYIGKSIAPGVPILQPIVNKDIRIVLKSGNFGCTNFFAKSFADILNI